MENLITLSISPLIRLAGLIHSENVLKLASNTLDSHLQCYLLLTS